MSTHDATLHSESPGQPRVLAFVLAGGEGRRLRPLTSNQSKPALHFVDGCRIVDFALSNLFNSGITEVYVLAQYKPESLVSHIDSAWSGRFSSVGGFVRCVLPRAGTAGGYSGTADAVYRNLDLVDEHHPDVVAVFAADHVYRMDVRPMLDFHERHNAQVTVAATRVPLAQASAFGVMSTDARQRIIGFDEKPERPAPAPHDPSQAYVSMGNYLFDPYALRRTVGHCALEGGTDFGRHVIPDLLEGGEAFAYDFATHRLPGLYEWEEPAYWRDVGTVQALLEARADIDRIRPCLDLSNPAWPIHRERRSWARVHESDPGEALRTSMGRFPRRMPEPVVEVYDY